MIARFQLTLKESLFFLVLGFEYKNWREFKISLQFLYKIKISLFVEKIQFLVVEFFQ